ncbi:MAG: phosphopantetheine adenylyltransferase [Candidatus Helarchaeota archaeon]
MRPFNRVGVAGTFSQFHIGHEKLLKTAFDLGEKVVIAITIDDMIKNKKYSNKIPVFKIRKNNLISYLKKNNLYERAIITTLKDNFGTAITDKDQDAIVVSTDTYQGALKINEIRTKKGLVPLVIIVIPLLYSKDKIPISSTRIRAGEIDRKGNIIKKSSN